MDGVRAYLLSVTSAAILCSIAKSLSSMSGSAEKALKLLCGLFLIFTVIRPLNKMDFSQISDHMPRISQEAERAVEDGKDYAFQARAAIIKAEAEAYILDKASAYGAELQVDVKVTDSEPQIPEHVTVKGKLSRYVQNQLSDYIQEKLGIPKEAQYWNP